MKRGLPCYQPAKGDFTRLGRSEAGQGSPREWSPALPWVRLDDHFDEHPKIASLSDSAFRLFVSGLAYCNRNLTDGFIPIAQAYRLHLDSDAAMGELGKVGLWVEEPGGWRVNRFHEYQPTKATVLAEREATRSRVNAFRERQRNGVTHTVGNGVGNSSPVPVPVPVPVSVPNPEETQRTAPSGLSAGADVGPVVKVRAKRNGGEPEDFPPFYSAYPRHIGRAAAAKAWGRLSAADRVAAMTALPRHVETFRGRDPDKIPHPATWLNGRRWEDELTPTNGNGGSPHVEPVTRPCRKCGKPLVGTGVEGSHFECYFPGATHGGGEVRPVRGVREPHPGNGVVPVGGSNGGGVAGPDLLQALRRIGADLPADPEA